MSGSGQARGRWAIAGWACYLGASWTWVIGMLWPVLLVRDFGLAGWIVFVVPNVVGAAAMGFVLSPAASRRLRETHASACRAFSQATVAFHAVVLAAIAPAVAGPWPALAALGIAAALAPVRASPGQRVAAAAALAVSIAAIAPICGDPRAFSVPESAAGPGRLAAFAPAPIMGFLLCPYLDLTFHEARGATGRGGGRWAFALGFGGVFLAMMIGSLAYAGLLRGLFDPGTGLPDPVVTGALGAHLAVQTGVTVGFHCRAWRRAGGDRGPAVVGWASAALALAAIGWAAPGAREPIYRGFLLLYGLVSPAYVLLCMWPCRGISLPFARRVWGAAVCAALPFAAGAGLGGHPVWVLPVIGILIGARALLHGMGRRARRTSGPKERIGD